MTSKRIQKLLDMMDRRVAEYNNFASPSADDGDLTPEQCMRFVEHPSMHPVTRKKVIPGSPAYTQLVDQCIKVLGDPDMPVIIAGNVLQVEGWERGNVDRCVHMMTASAEHNSRLRSGQSPQLVNPVGILGNKTYPLDSPQARKLLEICQRKFGILYLTIHINHEPVSITIPVKLATVPKHPDQIRISNTGAIKTTLSKIVDHWTRNAPPAQVYTDLINGIQRILDAHVLDPTSQEDVEDIAMELKAQQAGIIMDRDDLSASPSSSPLNSANRSASLSAPSPRLPSKRRQALLDDLEKVCIDMRDMITLEEFKDMKKKKLQLIVGVGPTNADGQQRCYYVKNMYNLIKSMSKQGVAIKEPVSKAPITQDEINNVIMPKMRLLRPDAPSPTTAASSRRKYPALDLEFGETNEFYVIILKRIIGRNVYWSRVIGYVPANIETESTDINSAAAIAKIRELFDIGRLVDLRTLQLRAHVNKPMEYWDSDPERKLALMIDELNNMR